MTEKLNFQQILQEELDAAIKSDVLPFITEAYTKFLYESWTEHAMISLKNAATQSLGKEVDPKISADFIAKFKHRVDELVIETHRRLTNIGMTSAEAKTAIPGMLKKIYDDAQEAWTNKQTH